MSSSPRERKLETFLNYLYEPPHTRHGMGGMDGSGREKARGYSLLFRSEEGGRKREKAGGGGGGREQV